jgi:penicillin amidase
LFQMDFSKQLASGTLGEILGPRGVEADKFYRLFGLRRAAEASLKQYPPEAMEMLVAYAQGVNAYIRSAVKNNTLPMEFRLLRYQPEEWLPVDSLTIGKYMAFNEGGHWAGLAFRYQLTQLVSEEKAMDLFPTYPEDGPTIIQAIKKQPVALNDLLQVADVPDPYIGSNNWVLSGAKSASGKPMLANDPHLSLSLPAIWYETNLAAPGLNVSGVNIPGIPGILLGHNEHIAWGITNMGPDAMDLYIEKRNPNNKNEFEYMGKWEPATIYKEHIEVKGADPVEYEILTTRHGPIISEFAKDDKPDTALALRWTALEPSTEIEAVRRFGLARDWNEFAQALNFFQAPAQNFVFASDDGTIAYKGNGLIPIRKKGNGSLPVPGWTDEYEWTGYIPWKELPTVVNPPEGFIATANNKIIDDSYPYHITDSWGDSYRATRIRQALESKAVFSEEDMQKLQLIGIICRRNNFLPAC